MVIRARGEIVDLTDQVNLVVTFKDSSGTLVNTDTYPTVSIVQPNGLVYLAPTTVGVSQVTTGTYSYVFTTQTNSSMGVWNDIWTRYS